MGGSAQNIQETKPSENCILMPSLRPQGNYVATKDGATNGIWVEAEPTPKELKLIGVEFAGVMCSATGEDQAGLAWVSPLIKEGKDIPAFRFANGNTLKITNGSQANVDDFEAVWIPFRESFFE